MVMLKKMINDIHDVQNIIKIPRLGLAIISASLVTTFAQRMDRAHFFWTQVISNRRYIVPTKTQYTV